MKFLPALIVLLVAPAFPAFSDVVKLKSGEEIQGRILSKTADGVVIEVNFSASIVEKRTIPQAEILAVEQRTADEAAFAEIKDVTAPATALGPEPYDKILKTQLRPFLGKYPDSPRVTDVRAIIATFEDQKKRLAGGEVKLSGNWLTAEEHLAEKYQIDAALLLAQVQDFAAAKDWGSVLNGCDLLQRTYSGSIAYVESLPLASEAADQLGQELAFQIRNLPTVLEQRQQTIDRAPVQEKERIRTAMTSQETRAKTTADQAKKRSQKFFPLAPFDKTGLDEMQKALVQFRQDRARIDQAALDRGAALAREANRLLAANEIATATTTVAELEKTWTTYEGTSRLKQRLEARKKAIDAASQHQAEAIKDAQAAPTATP